MQDLGSLQRDTVELWIELDTLNDAFGFLSALWMKDCTVLAVRGGGAAAVWPTLDFKFSIHTLEDNPSLWLRPLWQHLLFSTSRSNTTSLSCLAHNTSPALWLHSASACPCMLHMQNCLPMGLNFIHVFSLTEPEMSLLTKRRLLSVSTCAVFSNNWLVA